MLEAAGSSSPPEVLTFTPAQRVRDRWLERAVSGAGQRLAYSRDRVLEAVRLQRHHLVLDLNAASGLLTWDALRRAPEGGVWALAADPQSGAALRQRAQRSPEVERPVVLIGDPLELPDLLALREDDEVRFDAIVGRNVLTRRTDKGAILKLLAKLLRPGGCLSLAEVLPRRAQRLTALLDLDVLGTELAARVRSAEDAIYTDPADPMVNWDAEDLAEFGRAAGLESVQVESHQETAERRITPAELERWFAAEGLVPSPAEGESGRSSYAERLLQAITPAELAQVQVLYERKLKGQIVPWASTTLYLVAR